MVSHCIFVREYIGPKARPPVLLAYDIPDRDGAEALVQSIARSYSANGIDPGRHIHWFYQGDRLHEIYIWPQGGTVAVAAGSSAHQIEEHYTGRREHVSAPTPEQRRHGLHRHFG
jgi:hypothetical protein